MTKSQANALYFGYLRVKIKALNFIAEAEEEEEVRKIFTDSAAANRSLLFTLEGAELEGKEEELTDYRKYQVGEKDVSDIETCKAAVYLHKRIDGKTAGREETKDAIFNLFGKIADEIDGLFAEI